MKANVLVSLCPSGRVSRFSEPVDVETWIPARKAFLLDVCKYDTFSVEETSDGQIVVKARRNQKPRLKPESVEYWLTPIK